MRTQFLFVCALAGGGAACTTPIAPPSERELPETCRDVVDAAPDAADGEYLLFIERDVGRPWEAYCHDLQGQPREFLSLPSDGDGANISRLQSFEGDRFGSVVTRYSRVRIDPHTLEVDVSDQTFAVTEGSATVENRAEVKAMPFGVATACSVSSDVLIAAQSAIDLAGTPFAIDSEFCVRDADETLSTVWRSNTKGRADLTVYASDPEVCATASPAPCLDAPFDDSGGFQLQLRYAP